MSRAAVPEGARHLYVTWTADYREIYIYDDLTGRFGIYVGTIYHEPGFDEMLFESLTEPEMSFSIDNPEVVGLIRSLRAQHTALLREM